MSQGDGGTLKLKSRGTVAARNCEYPLPGHTIEFSVEHPRPDRQQQVGARGVHPTCCFLLVRCNFQLDIPCITMYNTPEFAGGEIKEEQRWNIVSSAKPA